MDNIISCQLFGTWSREIAADFGKSLKEETLKLEGERHARIMIVSDWLSLDDEVFQELESIFSWSVGHGARHLAYVSTTPCHLELIQEIVRRKKEKIKFTPVEICWFTESSRALEWVESKGY